MVSSLLVSSSSSRREREENDRKLSRDNAAGQKMRQQVVDLLRHSKSVVLHPHCIELHSPTQSYTIPMTLFLPDSNGYSSNNNNNGDNDAFRRSTQQHCEGLDHAIWRQYLSTHESLERVCVHGIGYQQVPATLQSLPRTYQHIELDDICVSTETLGAFLAKIDTHTLKLHRIYNANANATTDHRTNVDDAAPCNGSSRTVKCAVSSNAKIHHYVLDATNNPLLTASILKGLRAHRKWPALTLVGAPSARTMDSCNDSSSRITAGGIVDPAGTEEFHQQAAAHRELITALVRLLKTTRVAELAFAGSWGDLSDCRELQHRLKRLGTATTVTFQDCSKASDQLFLNQSGLSNIALKGRCGSAHFALHTSLKRIVGPNSSLRSLSVSGLDDPALVRDIVRASVHSPTLQSLSVTVSIDTPAAIMDCVPKMTGLQVLHMNVDDNVQCWMMHDPKIRASLQSSIFRNSSLTQVSGTCDTPASSSLASMAIMDERTLRYMVQRNRHGFRWLSAPNYHVAVPISCWPRVFAAVAPTHYGPTAIFQALRQIRTDMSEPVRKRARFAPAMPTTSTTTAIPTNSQGTISFSP
jgi:hypothetical protein